MSQIVYSNCQTLSTSGCYLYTNSNLTTAVSNGKYSNGTDCFTVSGGAGQITAVEQCVSLTEIIIDTYVPDEMQSFSLYSFAAQTSNSTNVDTNLNVEITWTGDLGGVVTETVQIPNGNFCNSLSFNSGGRVSTSPSEFLSSINVTLNPTTSGTQSYVTGTNSTGPQPC